MSDTKNSAEAKPLRFALIGYGKMGKAIEEETKMFQHHIHSSSDRLS